METMKHVEYLGNCNSIIDWNKIINDIKDQEPGYVGPQQSRDDPEIQEILEVWDSAGYKPVRNGGSAEWSMYYPGRNYDIEIVDKFAEFAGLDHWNTSWISKVMPGQCAPWHIDLQNPNSKNPIRIHCHIDIPDPGHILIIEDEHLINQTQGEVYRWNSPSLWHAATNIGRRPSYLFHIY